MPAMLSAQQWLDGSATAASGRFAETWPVSIVKRPVPRKCSLEVLEVEEVARGKVWTTKDSQYNKIRHDKT